MPILKERREAEHLTTYESLPTAVQEKVCAIELLFDWAILYLWARAEGSKGVPDFESYVSALYKNRVKSPKKDLIDILKDSLLKVAAPNESLLVWTADHEFSIKILADSRYYPWPGNWSHLVLMLYELWIYWLFWPSGRRFFEEGNETSAWYLGPRPPAPPPPSAPSFEARLDLSLVWLAYEVGCEITKIQHWGKMKEGVARINLQQRTENAQKVIDAFHQVTKNHGDTFNCIVTRIFKKLQETITKKTIERHLKDNAPLMAHCFKSEQRGKKKRIVYIGHTGV
jgi:hypothetical protein